MNPSPYTDAVEAQLLDAVRDLYAVTDPVPVGLVERAKASLDLRAWTIWQPWASAIVGQYITPADGSEETGGPKPLDNRPLPTNRRGPVLIHAARPGAYDRDAVNRSVPLARWLLSPGRPAQWVFGAIIGIAEITGCHRCDGSCSEWAEPGAWHVELGGRRALPEPVPCPGMLGFWRPTPDVLAAVLKQLGSAP